MLFLPSFRRVLLVYRRPVVHQPGQLKEQLQGSPDEPRHSTHQCDPLIYAKTLAAPGLCFWCLSDKSLPPTCVCSSSSLEPRGSLISRSPSWSQLAARFTPVLTHGAQIHSNRPRTPPGCPLLDPQGLDNTEGRCQAFPFRGGGGEAKSRRGTT